MSAYLLIAVTFACLFAFWRFLIWIFALIDQAHKQLRDQEWR